MSGPDAGSNGDVSIPPSPAAPAEAGQRMRVLTLNCWGLWIVAKQREQRIGEIAQYLSRADFDVVLLQEVFLRSDADVLIAAAASGSLLHAQRFRGGVLGGELVTLSRYPITAVHFAPYRALGSASAPHHGDFFAGKGIGYTRIATPHGAVDVYNTHTHANYGHAYLPQQAGRPWRVPTDADAPVRLAHLAQLAALVTLTGGPRIVVGGDFNAQPDSLELAVFRALTPRLLDAWGELRAKESGCTSNSPNNTLSAHSGDPPVRIDYLWSSGRPLEVSLLEATCADGSSLSDHMGVLAVVDLVADPPPPGRKPVGAAAAGEAALRLAASIMQDGSRVYIEWKTGFLAAAAACLAVGSAALGLVISQPWWARFPAALLPVLAAAQAATLLLAPLLFVIGMAGFGPVAYALGQAASELQVLLAAGRFHT